MKQTYHIEGMHCASCVEKIKSSLSEIVKVTEITFKPPIVQIETKKPIQVEELNSHLALIGNYKLHLDKPDSLLNYYPIFLIVAYISGVAFLNNFFLQETMNWQGWMNQFMAGFFLIFSAFKLLDIRGFAQGYATYDLLARRFYAYGFIYPFLELGLGILYIGMWLPVTTQILTIIIMGFSSLGVINSLLKKQKLKCACLGTILNVPLSSVTLVEDLTMVGLAVLALFMK